MSMLVNPYMFGGGATSSSIVAGSAPTSDQWRGYFPLGNLGSAFLEIVEFEMRATSGGADQTSGGTASSSSDAAGRTPSMAFDNVGGTSWAPGTVDGSWIAYAFPSSVGVLEAVVTSDVATGKAYEQIIIQYYNGSTWVNAYTSPVYVQADWTTTTKTYTFAAPTYTVAPSISYSFLAVGDTLTGNVGTYSNAEVVTYQWKRNGAAISGATSTSYTLVSADIGAQITFVVYIENGAGAYTGTSASVGPIISAPVYDSTQSRKTSDGNDRLLSDGTTIRKITVRTA